MNRLFGLILPLVLLSLTSSSHLYAGPSPQWPRVNYAYVKVFLYNLDGNLRGQHSPVKNGVPDPTLVGEGYRLSHDCESAFRRWLAQDLSLLHAGLSGCYIPHHAIIFYTEKNEPIAWMSACFLCTGIRFYSPVPKLPKTVYSKKNEIKAEQQLSELKSIFKKSGIPVMNAQEQYLMLHHRYTNVENERACSDDDFINRYFPIGFPISKLIQVLDSSEKVETTFSQESSESGDAEVFYECRYQNSVFWFKGKNADSAVLIQARITSETVKLMNEFLIGFSDETLFSRLHCEGHPYPPAVIIFNQNGNAIRFSFHEQKISQIDLYTNWSTP